MNLTDFAEVWLTESWKQSFRRLKQRRFTTNILAYLPNLSNPPFFLKKSDLKLSCVRTVNAGKILVD